MELSAFNLDSQCSLLAFYSGGNSSALVPSVIGWSLGTNLVCVLHLPLQSTETQLNPSVSGGLSSLYPSHIHFSSTLKNPGLAHHLAFLSSAHLLKPHILLPAALYTTIGHGRLGKMRRVIYGPPTARSQKVKWNSLSPVQLFPTPWTIASQAPLSMKFSGPEYWSG